MMFKTYLLHLMAGTEIAAIVAAGGQSGVAKRKT